MSGPGVSALSLGALGLRVLGLSALGLGALRVKALDFSSLRPWSLCARGPIGLNSGLFGRIVRKVAVCPGVGRSLPWPFQAFAR